MTFEQSSEDAFDAVKRLEWLILHASAKDVAKLDLEREVPMLCEQIRTVLHVNSESKAMVAAMMRDARGTESAEDGK